MEHLTYEDYTSFGGKLSINDFPNLLLDCEIYLRKLTFGNIDNVSLDQNIKRLMVKCIDEVIYTDSQLDGSISSYSDGIESISYNNEGIGQKAVESKILTLCRQYLPSELLYRGRKGWRDARNCNYSK